MGFYFRILSWFIKYRDTHTAGWNRYTTSRVIEGSMLFNMADNTKLFLLSFMTYGAFIQNVLPIQKLLFILGKLLLCYTL